MSDPAVYQNPLTPQQKTDWHDTSPDTPRTNAARMHTRDLVLEACAMERELAEALRGISETVTERDEARGAAVKANRAVERLHGLLREMKAAMLGYPMSMRALTPTALLHAIRDELREPEEARK